MSLKDFVSKQFIKVIHWTEDGDDTLAFRYPMQDMQISTGAQLTVRESQMALFVNEGRCADVFGPGLYTLNTRTLPVLTNLMNWDKAFQDPFKSDVYFFSTRQKTAQRWGTATPITIRDKDFGAVRVRGYGIYAWHIADPRLFQTKLSGTREVYELAEIEPQLRETIVGRMSNAFADSGIPFLDMAANLVAVGEKIRAAVTPVFAELGIAVDSFVVENLSLPEELQKRLDERVGMNMLGNMQQYTQFQAAQSLPIAAANEGGGFAAIGAGLAAGVGMGGVMMNAMSPALSAPGQPPPPGPAPLGAPVTPQPTAPAAPAAAAVAAAAAAETKFCFNCGSKIPRVAKFCAECGTSQPAV
ncbi:MAG: SPFH domain-containing protein [Bryobacteraceae bacterium]|jgi:membrane protease subunit (stomatin/prohibitin family)